MSESPLSLESIIVGGDAFWKEFRIDMTNSPRLATVS